MALKVKTKDWGSNFKALSDHIGGKSAALTEHATELKNEIANHTGHAYGRHGYQADWIAQLIRVVTGITPDQTFSPTGVEGVIREWNARWVGSDKGEFSRIVTTYDSSGNVVKGLQGSGFTPNSSSYVTSAGLESGGFHSPELQALAWNKAKLAAGSLPTNMTHAEYPGINSPWKAIARIMVVVNASPYLGFGVGYRRTNTFTSRTRDEVLKLVDAMERGKTRSQVGLSDTGASTVTSNGLKLRAEGDRTAFPAVSDLLDYLGVEAFWQKTALVILQKDGINWKRVTMYPCNLTPAGWAPGNKIPGKPWSGKVRKQVSNTLTVTQTFTVPSWRPA